jgi:hypothetical protein
MTPFPFSRSFARGDGAELSRLLPPVGVPDLPEDRAR